MNTGMAIAVTTSVGAHSASTTKSTTATVMTATAMIERLMTATPVSRIRATRVECGGQVDAQRSIDHRALDAEGQQRHRLPQRDMPNSVADKAADEAEIKAERKDAQRHLVERRDAVAEVANLYCEAGLQTVERYGKSHAAVLPRPLTGMVKVTSKCLTCRCRGNITGRRRAIFFASALIAWSESA